MSVSSLSNEAVSYNGCDKLIALYFKFNLGVCPTASWKTISEFQSSNCKCSNILVLCQFTPVYFCYLKQSFFLSSYFS